MPTEREIEELALRLQSKGPDEFPYGYYKYLARELLEEDEAHDPALD